MIEDCDIMSQSRFSTSSAEPDDVWFVLLIGAEILIHRV